ncbi:MAG: FAD-dependent oxidoreductase [Acaryochloridaceae cyanobacterium SU_2_1]|nr:FAD-dependent oxidoreductase [Acaryochloridaceae cyanobacterium SU_2_1]
MTVNALLEAAVLYRPEMDETCQSPLLVVGGSTAAYAATLAALQAGVKVCLVQPQLVVGGQFTAQGLPASDDGKLLTPAPLIPEDQRDPQQLLESELFALSRSQRQFRQRQRQLQPVGGQAIANPGGSWVSHLSVTPVVAAIALNEAILPFLNRGQLTLIPWADPLEVLLEQPVDGNRKVLGVRFCDRKTEHTFTVIAPITIEATDLGDLLELAELPSRVGQEGRLETGEAALPLEARPLCQQAITFCAILERSVEAGIPLQAPPGYDLEPWLLSQDFTSTFWVQAGQDWQGYSFYDINGIFRYRRLYRTQDLLEVLPTDVTVLNWATSPRGVGGGPPQPGKPLGCGNDYPFGRLVGVSRTQRQQEIQRARDRTQAFVHYLQTHGFPELNPRSDLTWTEDGIALEPYIREARRGIALTTIRHQDVAAQFFPDEVRARTFSDSVGIGQYHYLDVHPNHAEGHVELGIGHDALPFTLPLGALIPIDTNGLILSAKSIGTTHITNAAYRMHPMEWAIGEAGGHLAAFALQAGIEVRDLAWEHPRPLADPQPLTRQFQAHLTRQGIPLVWFNDISHDDPDFEAIQLLSVSGLMEAEDSKSLHFNPHNPVRRDYAAAALHQVLIQLQFPLSEIGILASASPSSLPTFIDLSPSHFAYASVEVLFAQGIVIGIGNQQFAPEQLLTHGQLVIIVSKLLPKLRPEQTSAILAEFSEDSEPVTKRDLFRVLYRLEQFILEFRQIAPSENKKGQSV